MKRHWRKSSKSGTGNNCVELCTDTPAATEVVNVRDSKLPDDAAFLTFSVTDIEGLKAIARQF